MISTRRAFAAGLAAYSLAPRLSFAAAEQEAPDLHVAVRNLSVPEVCAEKDNVQLDLVSPHVRRMRIRAMHPAYIHSVAADRAEPDFTACDMSHDPIFPSRPRQDRIWDGGEFFLVGHSYPSFWRPREVSFRVGDRVASGLHFVQLWTRAEGREEEVLVMYPRDGYWRARPLPYGTLPSTAYGSSFLVGPVEMQERPLVELREIVFDPHRRSFTLSFERGGSARITLRGLDRAEIALGVTYSDAMPGNRPFAALRSMYTSDIVADVAEVRWRGAGIEAWGEAPVMRFSGAAAVTEFWAGRRVQSRHNLCAPDMIFSHFAPAGGDAT